MRRHTIRFTPRGEGQTERIKPRDLAFGVNDGRVLLAPGTWDFIAEQQLGLATLATLAITSAALGVGGRDIVGIYFDQADAPVLRAEIFGGLDRSVRGKLFLRGRLYVGAAESPITSAQPMSSASRSSSVSRRTSTRASPSRTATTGGRGTWLYWLAMLRQ